MNRTPFSSAKPNPSTRNVVRRVRRLSRRDFAKGFGVATVFAPFLSVLDDKPAHAAAGTAKYLCIFFTNSTEPSVWTPSGSSDSNIQFSKMTEPLEPLRESLILIDKLDSNGTAASHGDPGGLTGRGHGNPTHHSLEQFVSDGLRSQGIATQVPNLVLGGVPSEQQTTFFKNGQAITPIASPTSAYQVVFGGSSPAGPAEPQAVDDRLRRRQSVLDLMKGELATLSQGLGVEERNKLDIHADSIRQLEERLSAQASGSGVTPVDCGTVASPSATGNDLNNSVLHLDLAVSAMGCDITRVTAVQFGHHQNTQVEIAEVGAPGDWHNGFMHSDNPRTRLLNIERWLCGEYVAAAEKMKALPAPDGDGSLFDQTLFLWARDMGDGVAHSGNDMRFVLSGGAGGYLKTASGGRYINGGGEGHIKVLINAVEAMGLTNFSDFGDPGMAAASKTPLASIST